MLHGESVRIQDFSLVFLLVRKSKQIVSKSVRVLVGALASSEVVIARRVLCSVFVLVTEHTLIKHQWNL